MGNETSTDKMKLSPNLNQITTGLPLFVSRAICMLGSGLQVTEFRVSTSIGTIDATQIGRRVAVSVYLYSDLFSLSPQGKVTHFKEMSNFECQNIKMLQYKNGKTSQGSPPPLLDYHNPLSGSVTYFA